MSFETHLRPVYAEIPLCSPSDFRLLTVLPRLHGSSNATPIQCHLSSFSRSKAPAYQTLSYAWGETTDLIPIYVNGHEMHITRNLHIALEHIRRENAKVIIWVDAVCINQRDDEEKGTQVQQMKTIYADAVRSIVWLGPAENDSDAVFEEANRVGREFINKMHGDRGEIVSAFDWMIEMYALPGEEMQRYQVLEKRVDETLSKFYEESQQDPGRMLSLSLGLSHLLERPYFSRVWIRQEFVVSSEVVIRCGGSTFSGQIFNAYLFYNNLLTLKVIPKLLAQFLDMMGNPAAEMKGKMKEWFEQGCPEEVEPELQNFKQFKDHFNAITKVEMCQSAIRLFGMRRKYHEAQNKQQNSNKYPLLRLLASLHVRNRISASDKRDRIFGVLGMASDAVELGLRPRYEDSCSWKEVYTEAARAMLEAGYLDLLSLAQPPPPKVTRELPSWAPDWSQELSAPSVQLPWFSFFSASNNMPFRPVSSTANRTASQIRLHGFMIDEIKTTLTTWAPTEDAQSRCPEKLRVFLEDIAKLSDESHAILRATNHEIYENIEDRQTACWRIPIGDQENVGMHTSLLRRATERDERGYQSLLRCLEAGTVIEEDAQMYVDTMGGLYFRRPFLAWKGYIGLVPTWAEEGDVLVVFEGARFPYVLRKKGKAFDVVGEAYVHGIMFGEFLRAEREEREFILV